MARTLVDHLVWNRYLTRGALVAVLLFGCDEATTKPNDGSPTPPRDGGNDEDGPRTDGGSKGDAATVGPAMQDARVPNGEDGDGGSDEGPSGSDAGVEPDAGGGPDLPCTTRIQYGATWFHPSNHPDDVDVVQGNVTWDGQCIDDGENSYAVLSNGWQPQFQGRSACIMAIDHTNCPNTPAACTTRVGYGASWNAPQENTSRADVVTGKVTWNGQCTASGAESYARFSNGWVPHFKGTNGCSMGFAYEECGGLYTNQLFHGGCADPGVLREGDRYFVYCTGTGFAIYETEDLVHYTARGHIFPADARPSWIKDSYWAPEVHKIGDKFVAFFTGRDQTDRLSIGMATADDPLGPFTDYGGPFLRDANMGMIDANAFADTNGQWYLLWKADGNAVGQPTPIYGQALAADTLALTGQRATLITNDLEWEDHVVEGPWVIRRGGYYYMFYSGNAYHDARYGVGVARATSPLGPYQKRGNPILATNERWLGPGHCSVVESPSGDTQMVYHAWLTGEVGGGYQRQLLVDPVSWDGDWPVMPQAPSIRSVPVP